MIDWQTIEQERTCGYGHALNATKYIPAGCHYDSEIALLGPMGRIVGRDELRQIRLIRTTGE